MKNLIKYMVFLGFSGNRAYAQDSKITRKSSRSHFSSESCDRALSRDAFFDLPSIKVVPGAPPGRLGRSWGAFGRPWGALGALLGTLGTLLGALGALLAALGALLGALGALLGALGALLEPCWPCLAKKHRK